MFILVSAIDSSVSKKVVWVLTRSEPPPADNDIYFQKKFSIFLYCSRYSKRRSTVVSDPLVVMC